MAQALLHHLRVGALLEQVAGVRVAQVVKPNARQSRPLRDPPEVPSDDVVGVEGLTVRLTEDEAVILVVLRPQLSTIFERG